MNPVAARLNRRPDRDAPRAARPGRTPADDTTHHAWASGSTHTRARPAGSCCWAAARARSISANGLDALEKACAHPPTAMHGRVTTREKHRAQRSPKPSQGKSTRNCRPADSRSRCSAAGETPCGNLRPGQSGRSDGGRRLTRVRICRRRTTTRPGRRRIVQVAVRARPGDRCALTCSHSRSVLGGGVGRGRLPIPRPSMPPAPRTSRSARPMRASVASVGAGRREMCDSRTSIWKRSDKLEIDRRDLGCRRPVPWRSQDVQQAEAVDHPGGGLGQSVGCPPRQLRGVRDHRAALGTHHDRCQTCGSQIVHAARSRAIRGHVDRRAAVADQPAHRLSSSRRVSSRPGSARPSALVVQLLRRVPHVGEP